MTLAQVPSEAAEPAPPAVASSADAVADPAPRSAEQVDFDAAAAAARKTGKPVEVESMAGTHTTVLAEPNGDTTVVTTRNRLAR